MTQHLAPVGANRISRDKGNPAASAPPTPPDVEALVTALRVAEGALDIAVCVDGSAGGEYDVALQKVRAALKAWSGREGEEP